MNHELLHSCQTYLERIYRERLDYALSADLEHLATDLRPVWRTVAASDLTSDGRDPVESAGLLLDPEIGLMLYVVPFLPATRVSVHMNRALRIRSRLSVEQNYSAEPVTDSDRFGAWRVSLCWLVPVGEPKACWMDQVIDLRRGTIFSEEVSIDAVFIEAGQEERCFQKYGFPSLLLGARQILKKDAADQVSRWLRADQAVRMALQSFPSEFGSKAQQALAAEVMQELERASLTPFPASDSPESPPVVLESLRILNFRNLADVDFTFGQQNVAASIIHGPNGTGKSSVCEALSIALFKSSYRYNRFADREKEKDLTTTNRASEYIAEYLTGIETKNVEPRLGLNGEEPKPIELVGYQQIPESELAMSGTILTQDTSLEFARMQADDLGARILRNYSELADRLEYFSEENYQRANAARQDFLRNLNLPASITLLGTAYERLASRELSKLVPASLDAHVNWLAQLVKLKWRGGPPMLHLKWQEWAEPTGLSRLAERIGEKRTSSEIESELAGWLTVYNGLVGHSSQLVHAIGLEVEEHRSVLADAEAKLRVLIDWRVNRPKDVAPSTLTETTPESKQLEELQRKQRDITTLGQEHRLQLDHLTQSEIFIVQSWERLHPLDCPTCGVNHVQSGGILKVVRQLKEKIGGERDRLLADFITVKGQIEALQRKLSQQGLAKCPLSDQELSDLAKGLQWLLPQNVTLNQCLDDEAMRRNLIGLVGCVRAIPPCPQSINLEDTIAWISQALLDQFSAAEAIFEAPDNWKPVKAKLTEILARVLSEHLPGTLAGLWVELAMNLTSAAWLLPDRPNMQVATYRGTKKSTLRLKGRLVRYILNQSEIHVLGLAWFFTRYLTHGRFHHACLILDDPSQEMDQTTYRELCRLLETLCRLHRVYERPLKLVMFMNQENRALDAARATGGITHLLGWVPEQKNTVSTLSVTAPGFFAPQPTKLFSTGTQD